MVMMMMMRLTMILCQTNEMNFWSCADRKQCDGDDDDNNAKDKDDADEKKKKAEEDEQVDRRLFQRTRWQRHE
jgi:hypothetical protein